MSSELRKELQEVAKTFKPSRAVYKISVGYRDNAQFRKEGFPTSTNTDFLSTFLAKNWRVTETLDLNACKHIIASSTPNDLYHNMKYELLNGIKRFIVMHGESKNNKLTATYRWLNESVDIYVLGSNVDLENDLWNIFKWIGADDNVDKKAAVQVLDIIRQRYEAKGIK